MLIGPLPTCNGDSTARFRRSDGLLPFQDFGGRGQRGEGGPGRGKIIIGVEGRDFSIHDLDRDHEMPQIENIGRSWSVEKSVETCSIESGLRIHQVKNSTGWQSIG